MKKRPHIEFDRNELDCIVIVHFKKMGKAARFMSKLYKKPPKGVVKLGRKND